jgi:putative ABC transport system substrate-binding protein
MAPPPSRAAVTRYVLSALLALWVVCALAPASLAADRIPKIGLVTNSLETRDAFVLGLTELGYREGGNVELHWRRATEDGGRDLQELVRLEPACLVLPGPLRLAHGRRLTSTIPIVALDLESDPVGSGIVASLARPGGNVTGIFMDLPELAGKQIQLLREEVPTLSRLAVVWDERIGTPQLRAAQVAARTADITLVPIPFRGASDLDGAISRAVKGGAGALLVLTSPEIFLARERIAESARRYRLASASIFPAYAEAGGLLGYGPNLAGLYRQAAKYVDRVLRGVRPADLPIERPSKFEFVVNLKTARALGLTIPPSLLARADKVVE